MTATAPTLDTPRLRLRAHRATDLPALLAVWSDPQVVRHIGVPPSTRHDAWMRMLRYAGLWPLLGFGYWAIEERASGRYVGDVGVADFKRPMEPPLPLPDAGWVLAADAWGRGYATEALTAVLAWNDARDPAGKTCCVIEATNPASIRVARKCGYQPAGSRRDGPDELLLFERAAGATPRVDP